MIDKNKIENKKEFWLEKNQKNRKTLMLDNIELHSVNRKNLEHILTNDQAKSNLKQANEI